MKVAIKANYEAMSAAAAGWIAREFAQNPRLLLCLATGSSPARVYELLGRRALKSPKLFSRLRVLKLDEWEGLAMTDPTSSQAYLRRRVIRSWGVAERNFVGFASRSKQPNLELRRISNWLRRNGPIDLCVLGLGLNGHLGFNEPAGALRPVAHLARLAEQTRNHPMLAKGGFQPAYGWTLGMAEILQARQILLLVSGAPKQKPLQRLLRGEISSAFPASFLWLHPNTTIFCDRAAAQKLKPDM